MVLYNKNSFHAKKLVTLCRKTKDEFNNDI